MKNRKIFVRGCLITLCLVFAMIFIVNKYNESMLASGSDERIVFAYGKAMASSQMVGIVVDDDQAAVLEITSPSLVKTSLPAHGEINYEVTTNGTYTFRLLDQNGMEITKVEKLFSDLRDFDIVEKEDAWLIISRNSDITKAQVVCGETSEVIDLQPDESGNLIGSMNLPSVNVCRITPQKADGTNAGDAFDYTSKAGNDEEQQVPEKRQITSKADLNLIKEYPNGIFEITNDIDMDGMQTLDVIFSGTLEGNGYQLYNVKQALFAKMEQATIQNVHVQGSLTSERNVAALALQAKQVSVRGSSFQGDITSKKDVAGFFVLADEVTIEDSYVSAKLDGVSTSGFIKDGSASITRSYVTGVIKAEETAYGFGKDVEAKQSYVAANLLGVSRWMFNDDATLEDCFYDASLNDIEEGRATSYRNHEMISKDLDVSETFFVEEGKYPQIKEEVRNNWSERSQKTAELSVFSMPLEAHENMATLVEPIALPQTMDEETVTWTSDGAMEVQSEVVKEADEEAIENTILEAKTEAGTRYFAMRGAQLLASNDIMVGERTATPTTTISFNATDGYYYKVVKADEAVNEVKSHKEAIDAGFKKRIGTGIYNVADLEWNMNYKVYETDLTTMTTREAKTNYGLLGGTLSVTGTTKVGETLTANLQDTTTTDGTWSWYYAKDMQSTWTQIPGESTSTLVLKQAYLGNYIKTLFTSNKATNIDGTVEYVQDMIVKQELSASESIQIIGNAEIGAKLNVTFSSGLSEQDFTIQWYRKSTGGEDQKIGGGVQYNIIEDDIGKQLYAIATTKAESYYIGELQSGLTNTVIALKAQTPPSSVRPTRIENSDTTVVIKLPDTVKEGLYRFGYRVSGETEYTEFPVTVRGNNRLTITGLTPKQTYQMVVRRVGENGYLDSDWGAGRLNVSMGNQYITGNLDLSGNAIFGETLEAKFITEDLTQQYNINWYRIKDGTREPNPIGTGNRYTIKAEDVGSKIEAEAAGYDTFAGFVTVRTATVVKTFVSSPTGVVSQEGIAGSNALSVRLPSFDTGMSSAEDRFIIGMSESESGYPIEYAVGGVTQQYTQNEVIRLEGLKPQTKYYIYVRYAVSASHYQSDWSLNKATAQTTKETFNGTISFGYQTNTDAIQGEKISARVTTTNPNFAFEGRWEWKRIAPDNSETIISNFYPEKDGDGNELKNETYFMIPAGEEVGTKYRVTYIPDERYTGTAMSISNGVKEPIKEAYDAPSKPDEVSHSDGSIVVKMPSTLEGIYAFSYGTSADGSDRIESNVTALAGAEVTLSGLHRNTTYYVFAKRLKDANKNESAWSSTGLSVKTELSNISGNVTLEENAYYGTKLTATYNPSSYTPTGDDSKGTWQWYRNDTVISGATSNTYTPVQADIGTTLKAIYIANATQGFQGSKEASTKAVQKAMPSNPNKVTITGAVSLGSKPGIKVNFHPIDSVYYRLQKASEEAPSVPLNSTEISSAKWTPSPKVTTDLYADYTGATLISSVDYRLYVVKVETTTEQSSSVVASDPINPNTISLSGSVAITGQAVVGKTLTATLNNSNNTGGKGVWKWYRSTQGYPTITSMPSVTDASKWTQIASGYFPTKDSLTSEYTVTNDNFGYYMKAEFVAEETAGYKGSIQVGNTNNKKILEEEIIIEGKGYPGETITLKLKGNRKVDELSTKVIQMRKSGTYVRNFQDMIKVDDYTLQVTIPNDSTIQSYDETHSLIGVVNAPDSKLYIAEDGGMIGDGKYIDSSNQIPFKGGIPITNEDELIKLLNGTLDLTKSYIVTNNLDMSKKTFEAKSTVIFKGTLDFDFHTVSGLKETLFYTIQGSNSTSKAEIKNGILKNADINSNGLSGNSSRDNRGIIARVANNTRISRLLLVDSTLSSGWDTGYVVGSGDNISFDQIGSAGGKLTSIYSGSSNSGAGGLIAYTTGTSPISNCFSVNTLITMPSSNTGIVLGGILGSTWSNSPITNTYVAAKFDVPKPSSIGGIKSGRLGSLSNSTAFYDNTVNPTLPSNTNQGLGKSTKDMIGSGLASTFGTNGIWNYKEGFYPQLSWISEIASKNSPNAVSISELYAATRGSFVSMDGKTSTMELFDGKIKGSVQVPGEFRKDRFSFSSSDSTILKVSPTGVITPLRNGIATVDVYYNDLETGANVKNSFEFTSSVSMYAYDSVTVSGTPGVGNSYASSVLPSSAASGSSYQWYRKKADSTNSTATAISGATSASYIPKSSDLGYQLQVKVSKSGYGTSVSNWSNPVVISSPTSAPAVTSITDSGFVITGKGSASTGFEYAYSETASAEKIVYSTKGASATITGMQRNKDYYVFSRIAAGTGYPASGWSAYTKVTTSKTNVTGSIQAVSSYNAGTNLTLSIPDTNLQTGTWKIERTNGSTYTDVTSSAITNTTYQLVYPLKVADIGYYFRVTYTGNGNFQSNLSLAKTLTIKNLVQNAPSEPTVTAKTDSSLSVKIASPESGTTYSFGYRESLSDNITSITTSGSSTTISGLSRNTNYYLYAKKNAKSGYEESDWSPAAIQRTDQTAVSGSITQLGTEQTEGTLTFTAPSSKGETGRWKLERFNATQMTTLDDYSVSSDGKTLTYTLVPRDAQNKIRAIFEGTGDFKDTIKKESGTIQNTGQSAPETNLTIVSSGEYYIEAKMDTGADMYQFGYRKKGDSGAIQLYAATAAIGKTVRITDLNRNSVYELYARKAAKTGYDAGAWSSTVITETTTLSPLNGNISFTGNVIVGETVTATFNSNGYLQPGDDSQGRWKWYLDGTELSESSNQLRIPTFERGTPELKAIYIAKEADGFEGDVSRIIGNVSKTAFASPTVPTIKVVPEDNTKGSKLEVNNTGVNDVYYYMQSSDINAVPNLIIAKDVTATTPVEGQWVKATDKMIYNLEPNKGYQLFAARLETDSKGASGIVTGQSTRTVKESLSVPIEDEDETIVWKAQQSKTLYYTQYGDAPSGSWSIFITKDLSGDWQNIDTQMDTMEQGINGNQAYVTFEVPEKFTGYYVKLVFTGTQDFAGVKEYISRASDDTSKESVLIGKMMEGHVEILNPDTNELLVPIDVQYVGDDEKSGIWTWYRETAEGSDAFEVIPGAGGVGVLSTYTPTASDFGRNIYALYQANPKGLYSGQQQSPYIKQEQRSGQNKPDNVTIKEINGTRILVGAPSNYLVDPDGTRPQVVLGYKEAKDKDNADAQITWQLEAQYGSNWFNNLKVNTGYVFYARYLGTPTYEVSQISDASNIATTKNENFIQRSYKLKRNLDVTDSYIMDVGNSLTATYSDLGWDEGYFVIKRSNGEIIEANLTPTYGANTASCDYTYQTADIGTHIIIEYVAKADAVYHSGSIVTATSEPVTKPIDKSVPIAPTLTGQDTTLLLDSNNEKYEYALTTSQTAPAQTSGDWNKLPAADGATYEFTDVKTQNQYYLHVRIAETATTDVGDKVVSVGPAKVNGSTHLGTLTLENVEDESTLPSATTTAIEIPNIITGSTLTIKNVKMEKDGVAVANPFVSVNEFVDGDKPHENVFTKGSDWGDQNFASDIQAIDADGNIISNSNGDGTTLNGITATSKIQLQMYRVNAIKQSGTYEWTCYLEDEFGNSVIYGAEIIVATQIKAMVPIKIDMFIRDGYIHQTSNTEVLMNEGMMPLNYQMDELAEAGVSMPNLLGVFNKPLNTIGKGEVFLKISNDGSNFTKPNGIWMRTSGASNPQTLMSIGAQSKAGYLVSGISDKTMNWPWASEDDRFIAQAYKFHFIVDVSKQDVEMKQSESRP